MSIYETFNNLRYHHEDEVVEFKKAENNFDFDDLGKYFSALLYNIFHPCATESLRFSFSRLLCAMLIFLCSKVFSSSPTLVSSNGFLLTTMV